MKRKHEPGRDTLFLELVMFVALLKLKTTQRIEAGRDLERDEECYVNQELNSGQIISSMRTPATLQMVQMVTTESLNSASSRAGLSVAKTSTTYEHEHDDITLQTILQTTNNHHTKGWHSATEPHCLGIGAPSWVPARTPTVYMQQDPSLENSTHGLTQLPTCARCARVFFF